MNTVLESWEGGVRGGQPRRTAMLQISKGWEGGVRGGQPRRTTMLQITKSWEGGVRGGQPRRTTMLQTTRRVVEVGSGAASPGHCNVADHPNRYLFRQHNTVTLRGRLAAE